jgi:hypothetical protein
MQSNVFVLTQYAIKRYGGQWHSSMLSLSSKSMAIISFTIQKCFLDQRTVGTHRYETRRVSQIIPVDRTDI